MLQTQELRTVLATYPRDFQPDHVEDLGAAGGFSGARFWRLRTPRGTLCLRRWPPEHPQADRLEYIHAVLAHVARAGVETVPVPVQNGLGKTYVSAGGCLWELAPWMPGEADYRRGPNRRKLGAAMRALAEFHWAAADFAPTHTSTSIAPAVVERRDLLNDLIKNGYRQIANAIGSGQRFPRAISASREETIGVQASRLPSAAETAAPQMPQPFLPPSLASEAERILTLFPQVATQVSLQLNAAGQRAVPTHPVIRDVWHDHLLFTGDAVTGLVDFGAMRNDSIAVDVSRLLGSLVGDDIEGWKHGLGAYQQIRPLSRAEDELIGTLDSSTILLSGLNWLRWIYLDGRRFDDLAQVTGRLREIAGRLEGLAARGGRPIVQRCATNAQDR